MDELERLAKPLIDYLKKNHHPHTAVVVCDDRVTVVEAVASKPILEQEESRDG